MDKRLVMVALSAVVFLRLGTARQGTQPDLSGNWIFDRSGSDDPQSPAADCKSHVRGPGGHAGSQQLDTGIFAHPKYHVLGETELYRLDQTLQLALDDPFSIRLLQTPTTVTLTTSEGDSLVLPTSGEKVKETVNGAGDIESRTYMNGTRRVIERKVGGGGSVTSEYFLSQDGNQLYVVVAFEGRCGEVCLPAGLCP